MSIFTSKNLLESPQRVGGGVRAGNGLEFTPIGVRGRRQNQISTGNNDGEEQGGFDTNVGLFGRQLNGHPLNGVQVNGRGMVDHTLMDSSFENTNTQDNFNSTIDSASKPVYSSKATSTLPPHGFPDKRNILNNGVNSIRELQKENQKLESENYNLKIKLATLTKFFDQTPEEQKVLLNQNIDLKQQLVEASTEIQELHRKVRELETLDDKENADSNRIQLDNMRLDYKRLLLDRDERISQYESQIRSLKEELISKNIEESASDNLIDELDRLKHENSGLQAKVTSLSDDIMDYKLDQDEQEHKYRTLRSDYEEQEFELKRVAAEMNSWKEQYERLQDELKGYSKHSEHDRIQSNQEVNLLKSRIKDLEYRHSDLREKLSVKDEELRRVEHDLMDIKENEKLMASTARSTESELNLKREECISLKEKLKTLYDKRDTSNNINQEYLQSELDSLRERERKLMDLNSSLKSDISELQDQLYQLNTNHGGYDSKVKSLEASKRELVDKLAYYEKEYELLEKAFSNMELENNSIRSKEKEMKKMVNDLEAENERLYDKIKTLSDKPNNSALLELENFNRKRVETEKQQLVDEVYSLKFELKKLAKELELEKTDKSYEYNNNKGLDIEYQRLLLERNQLRISHDEDVDKIRELETKTKKLQTLVEDKELMIERLEANLKNFEKEKNLGSLFDDREKADLLKAKSNNESKLRILQLENENLQNELESQINYYKTKLEEALLRQNEALSRKTDKGVNENVVMTPVLNLLEKQLEDSQKMKAEISNKLDQSVSENTDLKWKLEKLQNENQQLLELTNAFEKNEKFAKLENSQLEAKIKSLSTELNKITKHCSKLAQKLVEVKENEGEYFNGKTGESVKRDLLSKCHQLQATNSYLRHSLDEVNSKLSSTHISTTPRKATKERLLLNELQYYKAKLYDMNLKVNDLLLMHQFIMNAIANSNTFIQNDIIKLAQCGIYPDYASLNLKKAQGTVKLTFKELATFVLAMVRLQRRAQRSEKRKVKLFELKNEIEKDKINLLS